MKALIVGGSGSGKSEYAEKLSLYLSPETKLYIATMYPWDDESRERIKKHRRMRALRNFDTLECFCQLKEQVLSYRDEQGKAVPSTVLLECMSNLVANEMYCPEGAVARQAELEAGETETKVKSEQDLVGSARHSSIQTVSLYVKSWQEFRHWKKSLIMW